MSDSIDRNADDKDEKREDKECFMEVTVMMTVLKREMMTEKKSSLWEDMLLQEEIFNIEENSD